MIPSNTSDPESLIFPSSNDGYIIKENYQKRVLKPLAKLAGIPRITSRSSCRHRKVEMAQHNYVQAVEATVKLTTERLADKLLAKH